MMSAVQMHGARLRQLTFVRRVLKRERNTASTSKVKRRVRPE